MAAITVRERDRLVRVLSQFGAQLGYSLVRKTWTITWGAVANVPIPNHVLTTTTAKRWPTILAHLEEWGEW